ncbi:MAG: glycosyltransferase, partial [Leadbetterella sp.]|nr:glycosyltransferase [Leadbetterella sp.]
EKLLGRSPLIHPSSDVRFPIPTPPMTGRDALPLLFRYSDTIVACSDAVAANLRQYENTDRLQVIHSFVDNEQILRIHEHSDRAEVLQKQGLDPGYTWVCACGNADWRKAPDIFVQIAARVSDPAIRFAWIGIREDDPMKSQLEYDAARLGISDKVSWLSPTPAAVELINAMDLFLLCSREDPFPLVMLEAALCQKPVLAFKNTGGGDEFIEHDAGWQAAYLDVEQMAALILSGYPV